MKAVKEKTADGYVVSWFDDRDIRPLACFGEYLSAAIEFRDILNNQFWNRKDMQIRMWAQGFNPEVKYSYPKLTSVGVVLTKQKKYGHEVT